MRVSQFLKWYCWRFKSSVTLHACRLAGRATLDEINLFCPCRESRHDLSGVQPVASSSGAYNPEVKWPWRLKFYAVPSNIWISSAWNMLHVMWHLEFWGDRFVENLCTPGLVTMPSTPSRIPLKATKPIIFRVVILLLTLHKQFQ
jgi:hypothetical protein